MICVGRNVNVALVTSVYTVNMYVYMYVYCHSHGACISFHIRTVVLGGGEATILEDERDALSYLWGTPLLGACIFEGSLSQRGDNTTLPTAI